MFQKTLKYITLPICVLSLAFLLNGCYRDDIDLLFDKILELEEGNNLLQSELDKKTANDAVTDGNINSSISALYVSLESLKLDLTKSLEDLTALQELTFDTPSIHLYRI